MISAFQKEVFSILGKWWSSFGIISTKLTWHFCQPKTRGLWVWQWSFLSQWCAFGKSQPSKLCVPCTQTGKKVEEEEMLNLTCRSNMDEFRFEVDECRPAMWRNSLTRNFIGGSVLDIFVHYYGKSPIGLHCALIDWFANVQNALFVELTDYLNFLNPIS